MSLGKIFSLVSECCGTKIYLSRKQNIQIGTCSKCQEIVVRMNPTLGDTIWEWLDNEHYQTNKNLRTIPTGSF